jgi:hypothetical protein
MVQKLKYYIILAVPGHVLLWLSLVKWKRKKREMRVAIQYFVVPLSVQIYRLSGLPTLEHATYNCPCEESVSRSKHGAGFPKKHVCTCHGCDMYIIGI